MLTTLLLLFTSLLSANVFSNSLQARKILSSKNQKKEVNGEEKGETGPSKTQNPNMQATENIQCQGKFQLLFQLTMGHQNKVRFGRTESRLLEGCRAAQSS